LARPPARIFRRPLTLRQLFPILDDRIPEPAFVQARPRMALVLLCLVLWLPGFFVLPPTDRDESRFAQASKQMLETGDFVRIMNGAVPRNRKPIGIHWLQVPFAAAARAVGVAADNPIWPYRMPSLLGGIAAVLATFEAGLALFANRRTALLAGAMLAACVVLVVEAHIAKTDAALLGATTIAMAVLARAWRGPLPVAGAAALFWLALGAGILIKGPITPMVVGLAALTGSLVSRSGRWLLALRPAWGVPLLAVAVLPWFAAIGIATHGAFFADAVGGDLGRKLGGGEETHGGFPGMHLLLLPLLAFPATIPAVRGLMAGWTARRGPAESFLLCWLVPSWLVFEAVPTKLPHYTLPLYPAIFLLAGAWLTRPAAVASWRIGAGGRVLVVLAAAILAVGAAALPVVLGGPVWLGVPAALAAGLAGWLAATGRVRASLLAAALLYAAILQAELPALDAVWISPRAADAVRAACADCAADGSGLVAAGYAEPSLMFLAGTRLVFRPDGLTAARALAGGRVAALVAEPSVADFRAETARLGLHPREAAVIEGFNYSRGKKVRLSLFVK
jgi:4-amino-4-deoxy-L-arabinose transferase-like glycosyltransferase